MTNKFTVKQFTEMFEDTVIFYVRTLDGYSYHEKRTKADFMKDFEGYNVIDWDLSDLDHWVSVDLGI